MSLLASPKAFVAPEIFSATLLQYQINLVWDLVQELLWLGLIQ